MELKELMAAFAGRFGIQAPEIVDDAAAFDADGMPLFVMRVADDIGSEYMIVAADLGEPPPERPEKLYQALLNAGHNFAVAGGGLFSRNPGDGHIWLAAREAMSALEVETAVSKVRSLCEAAVNWRDIIREYREGASAREREPQGGGQGGAELHGFMHV